MNKAVFLDRDGVINRDDGYVYQIDQFHFMPGVFDALRHFRNHGFRLIVVTNQSGIGRGYYREEDFRILTRWMEKELVMAGTPLDGLYYCPHAPEEACDCRKPAPGMIEAAARDHHLDLSRSWLIGDKLSDIQAADAAGIRNTILIRGHHIHQGETGNARFTVNGILDTIALIKGDS